jgi:hypothetical protein
LRDAALYLAFDEDRLQHSAAIVDRNIGDERYMAAIGDDLDLGDMYSIREGGRDIGGAARIEILRNDALGGQRAGALSEFE